MQIFGRLPHKVVQFTGNIDPELGWIHIDAVSDSEFWMRIELTNEEIKDLYDKKGTERKDDNNGRSETIDLLRGH